MRFYIGIEDLAANALIQLLQKTKRSFVTYREIEEYGAEVVQILNKDVEKATLIFSRESTDAFYRNYSDFFVELETESGLGIALMESKTVSDLIRRFRGYLALDVLKAFVDESSVKVLGIK